MEKSSIGLGMAKSVDIPSNSWSDPKFLAEPLMASNKVDQNVLEVHIALISADPASHGDLESSLLDQSFENVLHLFILSCVPHVQKFHLNVGELSSLDSVQLEDNLSDNLFDSSVCSFLLHAHKVLLIGLLPSDIVMGVRDHVHGQVLVTVHSWQDLWQQLVSILLTSIMHVNNFGLATNPVGILTHVGLNAQVHVDGVHLILGKMHHSTLVPWVTAKVSVWTISHVGCTLIEVKFVCDHLNS
jgi:hypothetical protein